MALRQSLSANQQHQRNVEDAIGWQDATEQALMDITESIEKAKSLLVQGASDSLDQTGRDAVAAELEQLIEGIKQTANTSYRGSYLFAGTETSTRPYPPTSTPYAPADDVYQGDDAGWNPADARDHPRDRAGRADVDQRRGPAVPGRRPGLRRRQAARRHARRGRQPAVRQRDRPARHRHGPPGAELRRSCSRSAPPTAPRPTAWRRRSAGSASSRSPCVGQLSKTEDADIAETLIELNSQTAAYQAALRAGASIVQTSLMDFLR